jgi:hypothetical protein
MVPATIRRIALSTGISIILASSAWAFPQPESIRPSLGVIFIANLDPDSGLGTTNLITNVLGSGFVYPLAPGSRWSFEPSVDFYWAYYELSKTGRALPTGVENRDAFVLGLLVEAPVVYSVRLSDKVVVGGGAGLAINLRAGFSAAAEVPQSTVKAINSYLWSKGRFAMPSSFLRIEYRLTDRVAFGFTARALWPLFNTWAGEGLPFLDQAIFGGVLLVRYRL